ncbi:Tol biopolymer transport system component [Kribbella amoyensis]|uniref:Tol biopolymer transport system component n=1 Tax=Kribbella amoyensis TaxID=996641 RepID=A0A561B2N8_9ACTN|nr:S8 family serine peptidase [Kribbella amoyensis]TWD73125.1 Tol biopolymer transport system component [Kribbella amoyensis]
MSLSVRRPVRWWLAASAVLSGSLALSVTVATASPPIGTSTATSVGPAAVSPTGTAGRAAVDAGAGPAGERLRGKIDPALLDGAKAKRSADGRIEAAVILGPDLTVPTAPGARSAARQQVPAELEAAAQETQQPVLDTVEAHGDEVISTFWLKNMVLVRAKPDTLDALAGIALVDRIIPNFEFTTPEQTPARTAAAEDVTWGLAKIGADRVQTERGLTGDGVRVAVLDTGIDITHPDLAGKLVSADAADPDHPGGWLEFGAGGEPVHSAPHDSSYHGTHVAGTIAGGDASGTRIGVAPDAELMAGLVIPNGSGSLAQVIAGMEWALAPYDADGRPTGEPADVVSMSLGAEGYEDEMIEPVRNLHRAGVFPAFAIGNECLPGGSSSPGNVYESVSVGATDVNDDVPDWSCGGTVHRTDWIDAPAEWPESFVVPDISAPGVDVYSTLPDGGYGLLSGTSMATPHVSGTVALMLQARPDLSVDDALDILAGTSISDDRYGAVPNDRVGRGRIDALAAVTEAGLQSGIRGVVTDKKSRKPLGGVTVTLSSGREVTTDAAGVFELRVAPGTYRFDLARFGYQDGSASAQVQADRLTAVRIELDRTRWGTISGRVTYGPTGSTVPGATVTVQGVPDQLVATTARDGRYTIRDVPEGRYQVVANAPGISRTPATSVVVRNQGRVDLALPRPFPTQRVSTSTEGAQGNAEIWWPELNTDGSVVAYASAASNLVAGDTNNDLDVFVTDRRTGAVERVSVSSKGAQGNSFSLSPTLSSDGRYVGFNSGASNLVDGDTNQQTDAFVHDRQTGRTVMVSVTPSGAPGDGLSSAPSFSADGRYVTFNSDSTNLVPGDTNGQTDVFVRDLQTGVTERISVAPDGGNANAGSREQSISADGRYVAFNSDATNLSEDDVEFQRDVFVRDRQNGTTRRVAGPNPGDNTSPVLTADGRKVAFENRSAPSWVSHLYVYDLTTGTTELASAGADGAPGNDWSFAASITADGAKVAFYSDATNLVADDTNGKADVFVRDLAAGTTTRVSGGPLGVQGDGRAELPNLSGDGRYVGFQSTSTNLVGDDTNHRSDIFVHDLVAGPEARWALTGLKLTPTTVHAKGWALVTARLKNVGEAAGTYDAALRIDGEVVQQRAIPVRAGRETVVSFPVKAPPAGVHTVTLGSLTAQLTVRR